MNKLFIGIIIGIAIAAIIVAFVLLVKDRPFYKLFVARLKSKSPDFFKTIRRFCVKLGGACTIILCTHTWIAATGFIIPQVVINILGYVICGCAVAGGTTFLTTKDHDLLESAVPTMDGAVGQGMAGTDFPEMGGVNGNT